jgi:hypothetical protein
MSSPKEKKTSPKKAASPKKEEKAEAAAEAAPASAPVAEPAKVEEEKSLSLYMAQVNGYFPIYIVHCRVHCSTTGLLGFVVGTGSDAFPCAPPERLAEKHDVALDLQRSLFLPPTH